MRCAIFICMAALLAVVATRSYGGSVQMKLDLPVPTLEPLSGSYPTAAKNIRNAIAQLSIPGYTSMSSSGNPALPVRTIYAALPPDADESTIRVNVIHTVEEDFAGEYDISPVPPAITSDSVCEWGEGKDISLSRNLSVYSADAFYPSAHALLKQVGCLRTWKVAEIELWPCRYNPVSGRIRALKAGTLSIGYKTKSNLVQEHVISMDTTSFLDNADEGAAMYGTRSTSAEAKPCYIIMTTSKIESISARLGAFVAHKSSRGFKVKVVTESDWGGGVGDAAANNIRKWLQRNYLSLGCSYLLLIGDPTPSTSAVPMKLLWPRRNQTRYRDAPSDYYYADLTGNWDRDGDAFSGEYPDDFGTGGVDRIPELFVGRIPFYGDYAALDKILQKTIDYETAKLGKWSRNFLLPMKPLDALTQSYQLGEIVSSDIAAPQGFMPRRIYDSSYALEPSPECVPCDYSQVFSEWQSNGAGVVLWMTHGSAEIASGVLTSSYAAALDDSRPAIIFSASCENGYPEQSANLGYSLLKNGAVCVQSASRVGWYYPGAVYKESDSVGGLGYQYVKHLLRKGQSSGEAAYMSRLSLPITIWMNHLVFNVYGDPSVHYNDSAFTGISGEVTDISDKPISDAVIEVKGSSRRVTTSADGLYNLSGIEKPVVDLRISAEGYYSQEYCNISIGASGSTTLNFKLVASAYGSISGRVIDDLGAPIADASLSVIGSTQRTQSGSDGSYCLNGVASGIYHVAASKVGYQDSIAANVVVHEAKQAIVELRLRSAAASLVDNGDFENPFLRGLATKWASYQIPSNYGSFQNGFDQSYTGQFGQKLALPQPIIIPSRLGIYQTIDTEPEQSYQLSAWQRDYFIGVESANSDNVICRFGYDLSGGNDPTSESIIWNDFDPIHLNWNQIITAIEAASLQTTIFFEAVRKLPSGGEHCYAWFDNIKMIGPAAVPKIPTVRAITRFVRPDDPIKAVWEAVSSSDHYECALATSESSDDIIPGGVWRSVGDGTSCEFAGNNVRNGDLLYILVRSVSTSGNCSEAGVSEGIRVVSDVKSIPEAKLLDDGVWIRLSQVVLSRMWGTHGCFLQSINNTSGILAMGEPWSVPYMAPGTTATVVGCLSTQADMRVVSNAEVMPSVVTVPPSPLGMNNKSVGGGDFFSKTLSGGQKGSSWSRGLNNVGLLIKTWGRVLSSSGSSFIISDGSTIGGISVSVVEAESAPSPGAFVSVTGICTPNGVIVCSKNDIAILR